MNERVLARRGWLEEEGEVGEVRRMHVDTPVSLMNLKDAKKEGGKEREREREREKGDGGGRERIRIRAQRVIHICDVTP